MVYSRHHTASIKLNLQFGLKKSSGAGRLSNLGPSAWQSRLSLPNDEAKYVRQNRIMSLEPRTTISAKKSEPKIDGALI